MPARVNNLRPSAWYAARGIVSGAAGNRPMLTVSSKVRRSNDDTEVRDPSS
jgi:hypothetical protein